MTTLTHKITGQVVEEIANVEYFLANVIDPGNWDRDDFVAPVGDAPTPSDTPVAVEPAPENPIMHALHAVEDEVTALIHKIEGA